MKGEEYTVKHLRKLLEGVPDSAKVFILFETACGSAVKEESPGYDAEDNTFSVGCD